MTGTSFRKERSQITGLFSRLHSSKSLSKKQRGKGEKQVIISL